MDLLPKKNAEYGTQEYWDQRYAAEDPAATFDWLKKLEDLPPLSNFIKNKKMKILHLGCGNSTLPGDMLKDGYTEQTALDYSAIVIERMQVMHPELTWVVGDIRNLPFDDASFDVCIDKGTMDAMMTQGGDPWNPSQEILDNCKAEVDEVCRVLKSGGSFLYLTWGQPHFRKRHLAREGWSTEVIELGGEATFSYFLYVVRRTTV